MYAGRNPFSYKDVIGYIEALDGKPMAEPHRNYYRALLNSVYPVRDFSVLGTSGVGKTETALNCLRKFPQVIKHTRYRRKRFEALLLYGLRWTVLQTAPF